MKLTGLRVLDLSNFLPGPYLTLEMADHGAEVIKIEQPGEGDPYRHVPPLEAGESVAFRNVNRGKKSIALNLKNDSDREKFLSLVNTADVVVESYRPGVAARLGVDYQTLSLINPGIVYCSISAFGQTGPYRNRPAHDLAVEALSGALSQNVDTNNVPVIPALPVADLLSSLQGLSGILMALLRRQTTGVGDYLDIAMFDCMIAGMRNIAGPTLAFGVQPNPRHERTTGGSAFYRIYATSDGYITLAGQEPKFVQALLGHLNRLDLAPLCLQGPGVHQQPVIDFFQSVFARRSNAEWEKELAEIDVCFGLVNTMPRAFDDPQVKARQMLELDTTGRRHIASPLKFQREPAACNLQSPRLDEHHSLLKD